jgi:hypothetical protein
MDELKEFRELVAAIKADQLAQKEKEKRDAWTKYVSLSMIVLAVLAAFANGKSGGYSSTVMKKLNEATFNQAAASDQWAYYEAKSIKGSLAEQERDGLAANAAAADRKRIDTLTARIERYEKEKKDIFDSARKQELLRDEARNWANHASELGSRMSLACTILQISIAVGGVCLIVKKRWLWGASLALGALASILTALVLLKA